MHLNYQDSLHHKNWFFYLLKSFESFYAAIELVIFSRTWSHMKLSRGAINGDVSLFVEASTRGKKKGGHWMAFFVWGL